MTQKTKKKKTKEYATKMNTYPPGKKIPVNYSLPGHFLQVLEPWRKPLMRKKNSLHVVANLGCSPPASPHESLTSSRAIKKHPSEEKTIPYVVANSWGSSCTWALEQASLGQLLHSTPALPSQSQIKAFEFKEWEVRSQRETYNLRGRSLSKKWVLLFIKD